MIDKSIDRVLLHNSMFQPSLNIIGFTKHNGRFKIVADQTFVQGVPATEDDIAKFIEDNLKGFVYNRSTDSYIKDDIEISDLHEANFVKTENGKTFLIDCIIKFTSKTFSGLFGLSSTPNAKPIGLGSLISEPTKQAFYENLYQQLESIVKDDSFEKNGIRNFILSHIPEDYKNDDIEGIVEVFYQRLRALKCGGSLLSGFSATPDTFDIEYRTILGRAVNPELKCGICGEHGGEHKGIGRTALCIRKTVHQGGGFCPYLSVIYYIFFDNAPSNV